MEISITAAYDLQSARGLIGTKMRAASLQAAPTKFPTVQLKAFNDDPHDHPPHRRWAPG